ncbi:hypothetical protein J6590_098093 [Homalodisca vitripennis]|nr:hypothetical protein J6590_098093 [Homalodisca vitripennis]
MKNLETNDLKVPFEPPPVAEFLAKTGSLHRHPSNQQPRSTTKQLDKVVSASPAMRSPVVWTIVRQNDQTTLKQRDWDGRPDTDFIGLVKLDELNFVYLRSSSKRSRWPVLSVLCEDKFHIKLGED